MDLASLAVGVALLLAGAAMVWAARPRDGVSSAFMRNGFAGMLWPLVCLLAIVCGVAGVVTGTGLSLW